MNNITQNMKYRQSLVSFALKHGVSSASRKYNKTRSYIYFWLSRYNGTIESLACRSRKPLSHPNQHTEEELDLLRRMRRRDPDLGLCEFWCRMREHGYSRSIVSLYRVMRRIGLQPMPSPKPKYVPKPYENMLYPGQRIQIDVKFVPSSCLAGDARGKRFYQYTAQDEYSRDRYLEAFEEHSTYSSQASNAPALRLKPYGSNCSAKPGFCESTISGATLSTQTRYSYGLIPFSLAVSIRLYITALALAPRAVLANRKFLRLITNGLILRSARLLLISSLPSMKYRARYFCWPNTYFYSATESRFRRGVLCAQPEEKLFHKRLRLLLPFQATLIHGEFAEPALQIEQLVAVPFCTPRQRISTCLFGQAFQCLVEFSSGVRPAADHRDFMLQPVIARIAVRVQITVKTFQEIPWPFPFPVRLVVIQHDRLLRVPACPVQPHVALALRRLAFFMQHLQCGFIRMKHFML